jgi:hypothetical protein
MKIKITAVSAIIILAAIMVSATPASAADESAVKFPVYFSYYSNYWWRGVELDGRNVGVFWPGAGVRYGDFELSIYAGISQEYLLQTDESNTALGNNIKMQKSFTEIDYIIAWSKDVNELVSLGASIGYIQWPFYRALDSSAVNPSFVETMLSVGLKTLLNPKLEFFYDCYVKETAGKTPQFEDFYMRLSLSHNIFSLKDKDAFTLAIQPWLGYYNNAYLERFGFSDIGATLEAKKDIDKFSVAGQISYARSLDKDFQLEYQTVGRLKDHFWAGFETSYIF